MHKYLLFTWTTQSHVYGIFLLLHVWSTYSYYTNLEFFSQACFSVVNHSISSSLCLSVNNSQEREKVSCYHYHIDYSLRLFLHSSFALLATFRNFLIMLEEHISQVEYLNELTFSTIIFIQESFLLYRNLILEIWTIVNSLIIFQI